MKSTLPGTQRNICGKYDDKNKKITQIELTAHLLDMGIKLEHSGVSRIESGQHILNNVEIYYIAKVSNVPIEVLFESAADAELF